MIETPKTIQIVERDGSLKGDAEVIRAVELCGCSDFVLHKCLYDPELFVVTHLTGARIGYGPTESAAIELAVVTALIQVAKYGSIEKALRYGRTRVTYRKNKFQSGQEKPCTT